MKKYSVYQLPFEHESMRDLFFMDPSQIEAISDEFEFVAVITARTLDEAFRIGNFVCEDDEELRDVVPAGMRSISTGDIVQDLETEKCYVCVAHGWEEINMKEVA